MADRCFALDVYCELEGGPVLAVTNIDDDRLKILNDMRQLLQLSRFKQACVIGITAHDPLPTVWLNDKEPLAKELAERAANAGGVVEITLEEYQDAVALSQARVSTEAEFVTLDQFGVTFITALKDHDEEVGAGSLEWEFIDGTESYEEAPDERPN